MDSFDANERRKALQGLLEKVEAGEIVLPAPGKQFNVHLHSFHSYNVCGYSPSKIAWLGCKQGLAVVGIVDFDVFDGLDEFFEATNLLRIKACVGMETRVFIPEFADKELTSFGEPGITYHMGIGIPNTEVPAEYDGFYRSLKEISQKRNRCVIEKVNEFLQPVSIDLERDVAALTPSGNVTERHICDAYARKAQEVFKEEARLQEFWSDKLGVEPTEFKTPNDYSLLKLIRSKTMKVGGVGYVPPDAGSFLRMEEFNHFITAVGGIPALTWVDGISDGEQHMEELCELAMRSGVSAINVIPDPRYTPHPNAGRRKVKNLHALVALAKELGLLIISGTEMNIPGQHFVDEWESDDLVPLHPYLLRSAYVFYAHTVLQQCWRMGYMSEWAQSAIEDRFERNAYFALLGEKLPAHPQDLVRLIRRNMSPEEILGIVENTYVR